MRGKKRPTRERAQAVGIALLDGAAAASRTTGIAETTIRSWMATPEFAELRTRTKAQVADEMWAGVQYGFRKTIEAFDQEADVQKKATAAAIMFDKVAMLRGEATNRTESVSITDGLDDHEREVLSNVIRDELARRTDPPAAQPAVGDPVTAGAESTER